MLLWKDILVDFTYSLDTLSDIHWLLLLRFAKASDSVDLEVCWGYALGLRNKFIFFVYVYNATVIHRVASFIRVSGFCTLVGLSHFHNYATAYCSTVPSILLAFGVTGIYIISTKLTCSTGSHNVIIVLVKFLL